ncbi:MAG TPA: sialidase family protein [Chloroflexota bacterium]|jgi:photosystem II stability/assembly factor-like uncharacterized protein
MTVCLSPNGGNTYPLDAAPGQLLVGTVEGIAVLERPAPGAPWAVARHTLAGQHVSALLWEPRGGGLFAGVHGSPHGASGLYRSRDGGHTWERLTRGLACDYVYSLTAAERDGRTVLYAGMQPVHLYESEDDGDTWRELPALRAMPGHEQWRFPAPPHDAHVKNVAADPHDPRTLYVSVEQGGLFKSTDGGESWRELDDYSRPDDRFYKDVHRVVLRPSNSAELFMAGGGGVYYSADGGAHWEHRPSTARISYPDALLLLPRDERVMFAAGGGAAPPDWRERHRAESTVLRTRDGGLTWEAAGGGVIDSLRANIEALSLAAWPGGAALFAGTTDGEVYASEDEATTWARIASGLAPISKAHHYQSLALPA